MDVNTRRTIHKDFHGMLLRQSGHDSKNVRRCNAEGTFVAAPIAIWGGPSHKGVIA
jgi:hypothetical protein